jgi:flagella basal body P-ring formation protein FlgA
MSLIENGTPPGIRRRAPACVARCVVPAALAACLAVCVAPPAWAAEIQLRAEAAPRGAVVLLSDIALVSSNDDAEAAELCALALFPAPAAGKRFLRVVELQDLLALRGVSPADHTFSGANLVAVLPAAVERPGSRTATPPVGASRAARLVREAIVCSLAAQAGPGAWQVDFQLDAADIAWAARPGVRAAAEGGAGPWTGEQDFVVVLDAPDGRRELAVSAQVALPAAVVVAVRPLARGALIRAEDIELMPAPDGRSDGLAFANLEDVIGQEVRQAVVAGQAIAPRDVQAPLLVRRGDVVDVLVAARGVRVRTKARSRQDGSRGEVVEVESLADRATFLAHVSGLQQVEVLSPSASAERGTVERAAADRP